MKSGWSPATFHTERDQVARFENFSFFSSIRINYKFWNQVLFPLTFFLGEAVNSLLRGAYSLNSGEVDERGHIH